MKNHLLLFCLLISMGIAFAQNEASDFTGNKNEQARDPQTDLMNFMPNEVLVKFKDEVPVTAGSRVKAAGVSAIDKILTAHGITSLEKLFPTAQKQKTSRMMRSPQGKEFRVPSLDKIYRISVPQPQKADSIPLTIFQLIEELKALPEVEYAEPNYLFTIGDFTPAGPEMTTTEANVQADNARRVSTATGLIPNDPLYSSQWGIPATKIDVVWNTTTGDSTSIIAILDTGVDWQHPDLAANIWTNRLEIPGNGLDDDGNGLIDDVRGWDYINNDNNPMDDNSHGTHCAGIAAAVGNNGIGIAGANWNARIMPIKVFQSSGKGDAATIAKGVNYAAGKGATVISMSFGSYSASLTIKDALASAYSTSVLVAAAGNDAIPIGPGMGCAPMFPGAYSFVLGVEANKQIPEACIPGKPATIRACFSNYDQDGPVFSNYPDLLNYELKAPGAGILSCVPGGNYREYNGTSMAAPLVAGAVSLYSKLKPNESQELLFGNLINSVNQHIDLDATLNIVPVPKLNIVSYAVTDTLDGDKDGKADAGETIQLNVTVRNTWGQADSVFVGVKFKEFEDTTTTATIEKGTAFIGAIGSYATLTNSKKLLQIKIQPNVAHDRDIQFVLQTWKGIKKEYLSEQEITIRVEHGTELKGVLEDTLRLTSDKFWLVSNSFKIAPSGVLILEAGSHLKIEKQVTQLGQIISNGEFENKVVIEGPFGFYGSGKKYFKNTDFINFNVGWDSDKSVLGYGQAAILNSNFENIDGNITLRGNGGGFKFYDCNFNNINHWEASGGNFNKCNFRNIYGSGGKWYNLTSANEVKYCNFSAIQYTSYMLQKYEMMGWDYINESMYLIEYRDSCNILSNFEYIGSSEGNSINAFGTYWGTNDSLKITNKIMDFWDDSQLALVKFSPMLDKPSSKAHACVWKVVVNGKDAQDEFKYLDPLGVTTHKFEVWFNRPMDINFAPSVSMGVREPYNQVMINENASWSEDSLVYTVYKNLSLTANNGLNRIKVTNGKDTEGFDLVPELERFNVNI